MTTSSISANTASTAAATAAASASTTDTANNPGQALNQQDFLQLLVAQIQYQDPMNPQSNTDMAAQLAQFTSLQQASQTSTSLAMMQANSLVGSTVTVQVDSQTTASGVVSGVVYASGTPQITINGTNYNLSQVTAVTPASASQAAAGSSAAATPATSPAIPTTTPPTTSNTAP